MEGVPRLPMISFHLKTSPDPVTFGPKLKQYIRDFYNEDPESYTNEIHQLESLRAMAVRPSIDATGCALLKKYYCQLHFLQSRFPMGKDGVAAVTFTWRDAYANIVCSLANIRFEIISILYNIGAMHTQLGANTERTTAEGMKEACTHFQCAAWAFEHLKRCFTMSQPFGVDLAPELMTFIHQLCLAQAQECILEKSMLDNRKPSIVAKVAKQIVDYYVSALSTLEQGGSEDGTVSDTVGTKIYKGWKRYVNFKKAYYSAVTYLYQGLTAEEQIKVGERIAFFNLALTSLNEAHSIYTDAKGSMGTAEEKSTVEEALTFTNDVIEGKKKAAKNENEFIYQEKVPERDVLPVIKGASLVKGISFNINDLEISGPDIFARLVPMKVHEASSLYSEEKAKLLRTIGAKVEEKDEQLNVYLASLRLEHLNLYDPDMQTPDMQCLPIPDELIERCAALNAKPNAIQELLDAMTKLTEISQNVDTLLKELKKVLSEEEQRERQYQEAVGKRPPTIVATDLTREAKKYEEAHNKALESNQTLHKAIMVHVKYLKMLAQPLADLMACIPSPNIAESNNEKTKSMKDADKTQARELKRILNKVDEMRRQRNELYTKLREAIAQDDLTRLLVTATSESGLIDRLFADQLSKHQTVVNLIEQNLTAQENILSALTDAYAKTADVRKKVDEVVKQRDFTISSLITSYDAYDDMLTKCSKGLEFYRKLEINVSKLLQRVKSTCKVQEEEREQILAQDNKSASNKIDTTLPQEPDKSSTSSGLKLKDYLNSRAESLAGQYYHYKGYPGSSQIDSYPTTSYSTDGSSTTIPTSDIKPVEHYYPSTAYSNYRTGSVYNYTQDPNINAEGTSTGETNITHYPPGNFPHNQNSYGHVPSNLEQYSTPVQQHYNSSQYNSTVDYAKYGVQESNVNSYNQYPSNQKWKMKTDANESSVQIPAMPTVVPVNTSIVDGTNQHGYGTLPQDQMYLQQNQELSHCSATNVQNYSLQNDPTYQNYSNPVYPQPSEQSIAPGNIGTIGYTMPQQYTNAATNFPANVTPQSVTHHPIVSTSALPNQGQIQSSTYTDQQNIVHPSVSTSALQPTYPDPQTIVHPPASNPTLQPNYVEQQNVVVHPPVSNYSDQPTIAHPSVSNSTLPNQIQIQQSNYPDQQSYQAQVNPLHYQNTYQNYQQPTDLSYANISNNYSASTEIIQSHAKTTNPVQNYPTSYQYSQQNPYPTYVQYSNYTQDYNKSTYSYPQNSVPNTNMSEYVQTPTGQTYQYNVKPETPQSVQLPVSDPSISQYDQISSGTYQSQESNACYTNATNNQTLSQTPSSQYPNTGYPSSTSNDTYYTMQYGLQMQNQGSSTKPENQGNYNQTYMQAADNVTSTTTSSEPMKLTTKQTTEPKSNVDLLADLDIAINHAPLIPEVRPLNTTQQKPEDASTPGESKVTEEQIEDNKTNKEISTSSEDKNLENLQIVWDTWYTDVQPKKDPLGDPVVLQKFISDVEKYEKFVDGLLVKTLSGATNLDIKWREVQGFEERENAKQSTNVAVAHSFENQDIECIPYDTTRVQLSCSELSSSYINASHVNEITQWIPTAFIITQAPTSNTMQLFWTMIWEQESEVIACLVSSSQLNDKIYWPTSEQNDLEIGNLKISLKKTVKNTSYIQRILSIFHTKHKAERTVVHMEFLLWPSNGFPSSPGALLGFSSDVMTEQALRRCSPKPVVVHCLNGGAVSSLFLVAAATVCHIRAGCGIVDVPLVYKGLLKCRKQVVNKEFLLFAYRMVLYHAQDILMKRGILSSTRSTFENFDCLKGNKEKSLKKSHCHPSDDFLHNLGVGGQQRGKSEQKGNVQGNPTNSKMNHNASSSGQEKVNGGIVDPLSQLDPLWSIRR